MRPNAGNGCNPTWVPGMGPTTRLPILSTHGWLGGRWRRMDWRHEGLWLVPLFGHIGGWAEERCLELRVRLMVRRVGGGDDLNCKGARLGRRKGAWWRNGVIRDWCWERLIYKEMAVGAGGGNNGVGLELVLVVTVHVSARFGEECRGRVGKLRKAPRSWNVKGECWTGASEIKGWWLGGCKARWCRRQM